MHILVIDDEESMRDLVGKILSLKNHTVEFAIDGPEGLTKFQNGQFDLVITDNDMPIMTGTQFVKEVKKINPEMPVIMLSGQAAMMQKPKGVDILLPKPFRIQELLNAVAEAVKIHEAPASVP